MFSILIANPVIIHISVFSSNNIIIPSSGLAPRQQKKAARWIYESSVSNI